MLRVALLASLAAVAGAFSVQAAEVGDTFETSASVISSCSMTLTHPIGTLKYDPVGVNASQDSTTNHLPFSGGGQTFGRLRVVCNRQAGIMVSVGEGLNPSPGSTCDAPLRNMRSASGALLPYRISRAANIATPSWVGCGSSNQYELRLGLEEYAANSEVIPLAISIPAGAAAPVGDYSDTVTATVIF